MQYRKKYFPVKKGKKFYLGCSLILILFLITYWSTLEITNQITESNKPLPQPYIFSLREYSGRISNQSIENYSVNKLIDQPFDLVYSWDDRAMINYQIYPYYLEIKAYYPNFEKNSLDYAKKLVRIPDTNIIVQASYVRVKGNNLIVFYQKDYLPVASCIIFLGFMIYVSAVYAIRMIVNYSNSKC